MRGANSVMLKLSLKAKQLKGLMFGGRRGWKS